MRACRLVRSLTARARRRAGAPLLQALLPRLDRLPVRAPGREGAPARPAALHVHRHRLPGHEEGAPWFPGCSTPAGQAMPAWWRRLHTQGQWLPGQHPCGCSTPRRVCRLTCKAGAQDQSCLRGDACPYAHNVFEYWLHPTRCGPPRLTAPPALSRLGSDRVPLRCVAAEVCQSRLCVAANAHPHSVQAFRTAARQGCLARLPEQEKQHGRPRQAWRLAPRRYRTQLCNDGPNCTRRICFFAHSLEELRVPANKPFVPPEALAAASVTAALKAAEKAIAASSDNSPVRQPCLTLRCCTFYYCLMRHWSFEFEFDQG